MPSFAKIVIDALSIVDELRIWEQASCWVVPKGRDAILLGPLVCFYFENVWVFRQVVADTAVRYFV